MEKNKASKLKAKQSIDLSEEFNFKAKNWRSEYDALIGDDRVIRNRSGVEVKPLYTPGEEECANYTDKLGFPGQEPMTRGVYSTMHRGRTWTQRQLCGMGRPEHFNAQVKKLLDAGSSALSIVPCNSFFRGYDCDEVELELLGTCGTVINTVEDMGNCLRDIPIDKISIAINDPVPFTQLAMMLVVAENRGIDWATLSGTSNQSDYLSHFVSLHMLVRFPLPGARRLLLDTIEFYSEKVPNWNTLSIVGQHMQQAGATPAQAMGLTIATGLQYAEDCRARGMDPDKFLSRFTFFFDVSISFFEEIAKFRAGRRIWPRLLKERFGVTDNRALRFKFHAQTSGCDLTRQQPLNNIARTTAQAIAGIFGGLQSLHTNSYDEALAIPSEEAATIAIATQNILKDEAHLCDVIDPLGGSYYVESLTDEMEEEILDVIRQIDEQGGMYKAAENGFVQRMIGSSALAFQEKVESGEQIVVGVNAYEKDEDVSDRPVLERTAQSLMQEQVDCLSKYKRERNQTVVDAALKQFRETIRSDSGNIFASQIDAFRACATHGEVIAVLREELGFGHPLMVT